MRQGEGQEMAKKIREINCRKQGPNDLKNFFQNSNSEQRLSKLLKRHENKEILMDKLLRMETKKY